MTARWLGRAALTALLLTPPLLAESGEEMWLRYAPLEDPARTEYRKLVPAEIFVAGDSPVIAAARDELIRGIRGMLGRLPRLESHVPSGNSILLGTERDLALRLGEPLAPDEFSLHTANGKTIITGSDDRAVLYGAFAYLRRIAAHQPLGGLNDREKPYAPIRWVNQWDNLDGTVERGYGGRSIFWEAGVARRDLTRVSEYGRFLASLGIDACSIDNVNASPRMSDPAMFPEIARIAAAFRPWGVRTVISVAFSSPKTMGGLATFDPLDRSVAAWWAERVDALYRAIPDLAGFIVKADSEGQAGPSAYGRTHADAANVIARALRPHGGLLVYRGFVYNHRMDWRDPKNDRAKAAYDNFKPLDGRFDSNVVVQIKNGPIDFQVREPTSPLFGALEKTNQAVELQVTQEYMGQARYLVFLAPQWKAALDFDEQAGHPGTPVKALAAGKVYDRPFGGFAGVVNVGLDRNWLGNQLSQANLYAFGRLAWDPNLGSEQLAREWVEQTFGGEPSVVSTITRLLLRSWRDYENDTGPLGLQTLTDIVGNHYGVSVEASERNGWGQWHRADHQGVGMDRTLATGTGYTAQYLAPVQRWFDSLSTCPDDLILFFHHVPYTHRLHSGQTVIQTIYDLHYDGASAIADYAPLWRALRGRIDDDRFGEVLEDLTFQAGQADVWRDAVNNWFFRESGIPDARNRVGHHPGRVEAEAMQLTGYRAVDVTPWEAASGGKAISCPERTCSATVRYEGEPGWRSIRIQYFDLNNGASTFKLFVAGQLVDQWVANDRLPTRKLDGTSSTRRTTDEVLLRTGDEIRIEGVPEGEEPAALDYIELLSSPNGER